MICLTRLTREKGAAAEYLVRLGRSDDRKRIIIVMMLALPVFIFFILSLETLTIILTEEAAWIILGSLMATQISLKTKALVARWPKAK